MECSFIVGLFILGQLKLTTHYSHLYNFKIINQLWSKKWHQKKQSAARTVGQLGPTM